MEIEKVCKSIQDNTQGPRYWPEIKDAIESYVNVKIVDMLNDLLKTNCHPDYLKDIIREKIEDIEKPSQP